MIDFIEAIALMKLVAEQSESHQNGRASADNPRMVRPYPTTIETTETDPGWLGRPAWRFSRNRLPLACWKKRTHRRNLHSSWQSRRKTRRHLLLGVRWHRHLRASRSQPSPDPLLDSSHSRRLQSHYQQKGLAAPGW